MYQSPLPEPARSRRTTLLFSLPALLVVCGLLAGTAQAPVAKAVATADSQDLSPTERQRRVSKLVSNVIERSHYRQSPINDPVSALVLDRFIEQLDGGRSYFLGSDIAEFEHFRYRLDDAVVAGQLEPVFTMFNRFQIRNRERVSYALQLLKAEPDYTVDESFEFDRAKAQWAKTPEELNEIWRKRVKNDALSLMLTEKTWPEARDILQKRYERVLKRTEQVTSDDIFEVFMNAFAHVFDPHSSYFSPRNSEEYRIQMSLSYEGIGASLQLVDDYVTVLNILPGGAAAVDGSLNANDRILAVGEGKGGKFVDVVGWRLDDVVQIIRGKVGIDGSSADSAGRRDAWFCRERAGAHAQQGHARGAGGPEGSAQGEARRTGSRGRRHQRAELLSGLRSEVVRRQGLPQHHSRRAQAHRGAAEDRPYRCADHGSARQRRRPPHRGHGAVRPVHPRRSDRAAARDRRPCRSARRSRAEHCVGRAADRAGRSLQRFRVGDLRGRHPGLRPRHRRRPADLRQGLGAEPRIRSIAMRSARIRASASSP